jgi:hypothetical protein
MNRFIIKVHPYIIICDKNNFINKYPIVNHIDENKLNDNIDNLEWCTYSQNNAHTSGKKINQIDLKTKKIIKTFNCISDAKRELNVKSYINISMVCHGHGNQAYGFD